MIKARLLSPGQHKYVPTPSPLQAIHLFLPALGPKLPFAVFRPGSLSVRRIEDFRVRMSHGHFSTVMLRVLNWGPGISQRMFVMRMVGRRQIRVWLSVLGMMVLARHEFMTLCLVMFLMLKVRQIVLCCCAGRTDATDQFALVRMRMTKAHRRTLLNKTGFKGFADTNHPRLLERRATHKLGFSNQTGDRSKSRSAFAIGRDDCRHTAASPSMRGMSSCW